MDTTETSSGTTQQTGNARVITAALEHIYISPGHDYWRKPDAPAVWHGIRDVPEVECVPGKGLVGDRYFHGKAGKMGQVTFFDAATADAIREQFGLPDLAASVFRRNLIVRGVTLSELLNREFVFQGVTFEGVQECKPCVWMDRAVTQGVQAFMRDAFRGGLRARIRTGGVLRVTGKND